MELRDYPSTHSNQTPNTAGIGMGVRLWAIMFMVKRGTTLTAS